MASSKTPALKGIATLSVFLCVSKSVKGHQTVMGFTREQVQSVTWTIAEVCVFCVYNLNVYVNSLILFFLFAFFVF